DGGGPPMRVFLKTRRADTPVAAEASGRREVEFYSRVAPVMPGDLLARCYEADASTDDAWHLLLEDLDDSHGLVTDWPFPPALAQCERILTAFARFHGFWWDDPRLGTSIGAPRDPDALARWEFPAHLATFADRLGESLSTERRRLFERFVASAPRR